MLQKTVDESSCSETGDIGQPLQILELATLAEEDEPCGVGKQQVEKQVEKKRPHDDSSRFVFQ